MRVLSGPSSKWSTPRETSATIGVFDGVHLGHRALLERLRPDLEKTVLTFEPHPVEVLRQGMKPRLITTIDERIELLEGAGVSQVGILDLRDIRALGPEEFVEEVLVTRLGMRHLVLGPDFRFGRDRSGDVSLLGELGGVHGFDVEIVDVVSDETGPISSSRIRELIEAGQVGAASELLGTRFRVSGPVIHGDKRGADLGYPTANIAPPARKVIPAPGVYAAFAHVRDEVRRAAVNVGYRPTFGGSELVIEAYILDFDQRIYGAELTVEFVEYLREELEFNDVGELIERMAEDVEQTKRLLESTASNVG